MVEVKTVSGRRDIKKFVLFPLSLYKNHPCYVPDMVSSQINDLLEDKNPAFEYCEARSFLAYKDGKLSGRVTGILNTRANEKDGHNYLRFANFDFVDDAEVTNALYHALEDYARELGCEGIHGPQGFSDMDREGMLVEGFEYLSQFFTYYNYPYYIQHLERLGYAKDVDWVEFLIDVPTDARLIDRLGKLSDRVLAHNRLHVAEVKRRRDFQPYVEKVFRLWNTAYAPLYGTTTLDDTQVKRYVKKFLPMIDPRLACFVMDEQDELVAFGVSAPSIASALKKSNGRLFPFGFVGVLRALKHNDTLDLFLIAVRPEYQNCAVNAVAVNHVMRGCMEMGIQRAETGPQLETNHKILSQWNMFSPKQHKRRRCWIKQL